MKRGQRTGRLSLVSHARQGLLEKRIASERKHVAELKHLVGCVIQAIEGHEIDDGQAELLLAGVVAEFRRIEDEYE